MHALGRYSDKCNNSLSLSLVEGRTGNERTSFKRKKTFPSYSPDLPSSFLLPPPSRTGFQRSRTERRRCNGSSRLENGTLFLAWLRLPLAHVNAPVSLRFFVLDKDPWIVPLGIRLGRGNLFAESSSRIPSRLCHTAAPPRDSSAA